MELLRSSWLIAASIFVASCSTYPLPQDTTGDNTIEIISKVRCEVQLGLQQVLRSVFERHYFEIVYREPGREATGRELAQALSTGEMKLDNLKIWYFIDSLRNSIKYYSTAAVGYEFTLDLTENNANGIGVGLSRSSPLPLGSIGVGARADRTRQVSRTFRIVDTFEDLFNDYNEVYCQKSRNIDIIYPIRSSKPIFDLLDSFIHANEFMNLQGDKEKAAVNKMADTIEFTTKISGSIEPSFTLPIAGDGFFLTSIGVINNSYRSDRHKVILTLTVAPKRDPEKSNFKGLSVAINSRSKAYRVDYANQSIDEQRIRNTQDAIIQLGNSVSRLAP